MKQDKVKGFIDDNRNQFDDLQPHPELWHKIEKNMIATGLFSATAGKAGLLLKTGAAKALLAGAIGFGFIGSAAFLYNGIGNISDGRSANTMHTKQQHTNNQVAKQISIPPKHLQNSLASGVSNKQNENNITQTTYPPIVAVPAVISTASPVVPMPQSATSSVAYLPGTATSSRYFEARWKDHGSDIAINIDTTISNIHYIRINSNGLNWAITGKTTTNVQINARATGKPEGPNIANYSVNILCTVKGDTLILNGSFTSAGGRFNSHRQSLVQLAIPTDAAIIASEECGSISAMHLAGNTCELTTEDGNIKASEVITNATLTTRSTGNIWLDQSEGIFNTTTRLGNINIANSRGKVSATTNTGNIVMEQYSGNVNNIAGNGNNMLTNCNGKFSITTHTGNCMLTNCSGQWDILTEIGNIKALKLLLTDNANLTTTTGNINVQLDNPSADLSFDLHGGIGKISVHQNEKTINESSTLQTGNGKYKITSSVNTGNQEYQCNSQ